MSRRLGHGDLITVFGGAGFVGRHAVRALAKRGFRIRVAVRRPDLAGHLQPMGNVGQIHAVQANLRYPDSIREAVAGADGVINLVGILAESRRQTFEAIHIDGARGVARAAREAGARSLLHLSAIGADPHSRSAYARSKAGGEAAVHEELGEAVILRPSVIFGPEDEFFNRFAVLARVLPVLPLIGGGKTRFQPVFVGDIAAAIVAALDGAAAAGAVYELGGPEIITLADVMKRVLAYTERRRALVTMPFWLAKIQAFFASPLPNPPITVDQVRLLQSDNVVSEEAMAAGRTLAGLGIDPPQAIESIVPSYLERFNPKGQYAHYRG